MGCLRPLLLVLLVAQRHGVDTARNLLHDDDDAAEQLSSPPEEGTDSRTQLRTEVVQLQGSHYSTRGLTKSARTAACMLQPLTVPSYIVAGILYVLATHAKKGEIVKEQTAYMRLHPPPMGYEDPAGKTMDERNEEFMRGNTPSPIHEALMQSKRSLKKLFNLALGLSFGLQYACTGSHTLGPLLIVFFHFLLWIPTVMV